MQDAPLVRHYMIEMTTCLAPDDNVYDALDLLVKKNTTGLPVIDEEDRLVGFLTEKDCLRLIAISHLYNMTGRRVRDIMSGISQALHPENDMLAAAMVFLSTNFAHLPVMEGERLVGSLSRQLALAAIQQFYRERGREFANGKHAQDTFDNPSSIAQLQNLVGMSSREQMASVLQGRHVDTDN